MFDSSRVAGDIGWAAAVIGSAFVIRTLYERSYRSGSTFWHFGGVSRGAYLLWALPGAWTLISLVTIYVALFPHRQAALITTLPVLFFLVMRLAPATLARLEDIGESKAHAWLLLVPFYNISVLYWLLTERCNRRRPEGILARLLCSAGVHSWDACRCRRCGRYRKTGHIWEHCQCRKCHASRDTDHLWEGCRCRVCRKTRDEGHVWLQFRCGARCSTCGSRRGEDHVWRLVGSGRSRGGMHDSYETYKCEHCGESTIYADSWLCRDGSVRHNPEPRPTFGRAYKTPAPSSPYRTRKPLLSESFIESAWRVAHVTLSLAQWAIILASNIVGLMLLSGGDWHLRAEHWLARLVR